ncbi:bifunctional folylpolyglutamate synthase/dihydrofolate synthase [Lederbergia wuyishanensis]|uniref:tetrahydrofolate synthase n=1 Tax=Lederbergia wuyishanensis TaxID=1347903 RepID=A0ABU0D1U1_9BACI|nr:folylpolyglutamate synthase/dihydrofolate synthase family protein [Lederbergia wuyishanensis]MCJ8006998.1 bifunctional folylpolyglutamate synthase/dihydrofolate synthase [Lederbergia wuyishanensis]MDQ0342382.1 dihydrofolate synthase/folylpolyglutamate synthase [Lederbergia wuyishanensis]
MLQSYKEALEWIHSRLRLGIKPGLTRMDWMLERLGNPEKELKSIHVGGTNGKGSTVTYLRSILNEAGYKVGTFTSPYIEQFNERISVDGKPIHDDEITELTNIIKPLADELEKTELGSPTEFEVITAMALYYFAKVNPMDITVIEVGLGGRFDSTNVIEPIASIITNVGMDHTQILGDTISKIAFEKAGIIKKNTPIITCVKNEEALAVLKEIASEKHAEMIRIEKDFIVSGYRSLKEFEQFTYTSKIDELKDLELSLLGKHQTENAAGAIAALEFLNSNGFIHIDKNKIRSGLKKAYWPGRMEIMQEHPTVLIDGAHNPEGVQAFANAIQQRYSDKKVKIVFSALKDKDLTEMFSTFNKLDVEMYLTEFDFPRAASAQELMEQCNNPMAKADSNWEELLKKLISSLKDDEVLAITGSLYFISTIKPFLKGILKPK